MGDRWSKKGHEVVTAEAGFLHTTLSTSELSAIFHERGREARREAERLAKPGDLSRIHHMGLLQGFLPWPKLQLAK